MTPNLDVCLRPMVPRSIFEAGLEACKDEIKIKKEDRPKIQRWLENWLVKVSTDKPGKWSDQFKVKLIALSKTIDLEYDQDKQKIKAVCGPADSETLAYLTRGTMWFDGIDRIESEIVRVISTSNLNPEP